MATRELIKERGIQVLWHFTRLENLDLIIRWGIIPRGILERDGAIHVVNDAYRADGCSNASCLSISFPNYKMFYSLRMNTASTWVLIAIKPNILWEKECAFCASNAASSNVTQIPLENRKGNAAFNAMFADVEGKPSRREMRLPINYPTDPQAEVLVFDTILPDDFLGVAVQKQSLADELSARYRHIDIKHFSEPFLGRFDYEHWR